MERGSLGVGPDSGSFRFINVLYYFVLGVAEDVVARFVFLLADLSADFD